MCLARGSNSICLATVPTVCFPFWYGCGTGARAILMPPLVSTAESAGLWAQEKQAAWLSVPDHRKPLSFLILKAPSGKQIGVMHYLSLCSKQIPPRWLWSIRCVALLHWLPAKPVSPKGRGYLSDYSSFGSGKDHWLVCGLTGWDMLVDSPALFMLPLVCLNSCFLPTSWGMWMLCTLACDQKALLSLATLPKDLYNTSVLPSRTVFSTP